MPSPAGLITLGTYPQRHLPRLHISFIHLPGTSKGAGPGTGPRSLDNQPFSGPLPVMVEDAVAAVVRDMALRSTVVGAGRRDEHDYPVEAVREAVVNAVLHRDHSPLSRGTQVQVEMYADRLTVTSPGGLYGPVTLDTLGETSSSRTSQLAVLLADVPLPDRDRVVCENRGSGIPVMFDLLRRAGTSVPRFSTSLSRFSITFPEGALLDAATVARPPLCQLRPRTGARRRRTATEPVRPCGSTGEHPPRRHRAPPADHGRPGGRGRPQHRGARTQHRAAGTDDHAPPEPSHRRRPGGRDGACTVEEPALPARMQAH